MNEQEDKHKVKKASELLELHEATIIKELGPRAFDELSPQEAANLLDIEARKLPDLVRQTWLASVPDKSIGSAHFYYRWRVEFVKRYKRKYQSQKAKPQSA